MKTIWLVIPCYNEEEVLPKTHRQLKSIIQTLMEQGKITRESKIAWVNDGSKDATWSLIETYCREDTICVGINLSRNEGHQKALLAGLMTARKYADAAISMDADLQDDVNAIELFIEEYENGADIVYGVRSSRAQDTAFKKHTAQGFYRWMQRMGVELVYNHADYRLMSRRALEGLSEFREVNLFLRGIIPQIGYRTAVVEYERKERAAGSSKYPLQKMLAFALEGITSFTTKPIRIITKIGIFTFSISILMLLYFFIQYATGNTVHGWASLAVSIWALGGLQLLGIGIVGEYIGKIYLETKQRPNYLIEQVLFHEKAVEKSPEDLE